MAARNGHVPASELVTVEDNDQLYAPVANAFFRARAAYYAEGGSGSCIVEPAGSYRSFWVQQDMNTHPSRYNLNPNSKVGLAAPGYSNHGLGDCLDAAPGFHRFLLRRGREFGFYRPFGDRDPNHWRHDGHTATGALTGSASLHTRKASDMIRIHHKVGKDQAIYLWNGQTAVLSNDLPGVDMDELPVITITDDAKHTKLTNFINRERLTIQAGEVAAAAAVAAEVRKLLAADFAAIPGAVITEQKKPGN